MNSWDSYHSVTASDFLATKKKVETQGGKCTENLKRKHDLFFFVGDAIGFV